MIQLRSTCNLFFTDRSLFHILKSKTEYFQLYGMQGLSPMPSHCFVENEIAKEKEKIYRRIIPFPLVFLLNFFFIGLHF